MSTARRFQEFVSNLQLTDTQIDDAITKHTGVRRTLHNNYYSHSFVKSFPNWHEENVYKNRLKWAYKSTSFDILAEDFKQRTSLLVGSYGKNTAIRPPSDIDILFEMPSSEYYRYNNYAYNGQSALLQAVKNILCATYPNTKIRADGQIVSIPFTTYNIEVLPAFRLQSGQYLFPDTNNGGSWRITDPKAEMENISKSNGITNGNTVRLIKMIKRWKRHWDVPIKSLVIELRSVNFLSTWSYSNGSYSYYPWMVRDFFAALLTLINGYFPIPGIDENVYYGDKWVSYAESALAISRQACQYESEQNYILAAGKWRELFGSDYPLY